MYLLDIDFDMEAKGEGKIINLEGIKYILKQDEEEGGVCTNCDLRNYKSSENCAEDSAHPDFEKMMKAISEAEAHECNNGLIWKKINIKHNRKKLKITPRLQTPS